MTEKKAKQIRNLFGKKFSEEIKTRNISTDCDNSELSQVLKDIIPPLAINCKAELFIFNMGHDEIAFVLYSKNKSSYGLLIELSEMAEQYNCRIMTPIIKPEELQMTLSAFGYKD